MNRPAIVLAVLFITFLLTPTLVAAQYSSSQVVDFIWVKTFGFERQWLNNPQQLILNALLPAVAIYAIFLGLLRTMRLFEGMGAMDHVIALVVMFAALFTGGIGYISGLLFFLGNWSVILFFILFLIGSILYAKGFIGKYRKDAYGEIASAEKKITQNYSKRIRAIEDELAKLEKEYAKAEGNEQAQQKLRDRMTEKEYKRKRLMGQIKGVEESFFTLPGGIEEFKKKRGDKLLSSVKAK